MIGLWDVTTNAIVAFVLVLVTIAAIKPRRLGVPEYWRWVGLALALANVGLVFSPLAFTLTQTIVIIALMLLLATFLVLLLRSAGRKA